jgi:DNA-binding transcriptional MerR regulator
MAVYSIKELEKLSGIKAHTIRIWEKRYDLIQPHRTNTNIRYYTDEDLKKILNVAVLNRQGIKISNIARLNDLELKEEIIRVSRISDSPDTFVDSLVVAMIDMDKYKIESLIDKSVSKVGFTASMVNVLYPFLEKVGILWQSGEVNPAQEHFISYLIRQKLIAAIDRLPGTYNPMAKRFILLLPEGEWHELSLLFGQYLLREAGQEVTYLGQSVPYADLLAVGASKDFDYLLVSSITPQPEFDFLVYLKDLGGAFPDKQIIFFSNFLGDASKILSERHIHMHGIQDFMDFISSLN